MLQTNNEKTENYSSLEVKGLCICALQYLTHRAIASHPITYFLLYDIGRKRLEEREKETLFPTRLSPFPLASAPSIFISELTVLGSAANVLLESGLLMWPYKIKKEDEECGRSTGRNRKL